MSAWPDRINFSFMIGGSSKSGTSFLHEALMKNPGIHLPPREVHEFLPGYFSPQCLTTLEKDLDYSKIVGIKRPDLIFNFNAIHNVRRIAGPDIKTIIILRDPVVRAISHFFHFRGLAQIKFCSFDAFADALTRGDLPSLGLRAHEIELHSRYREAIEHCKSLFGASNMLLINFEDLTTDPQTSTDRVCAFIGAAPSPVPEMPFIPQRVFYNESSQIYLARAARLEGYCGPHRAVVAYRQQPTSWPRRFMARRFREKASLQDNATTKPQFLSKALDRLKEHFLHEYAYAESLGLTFTELNSLVTRNRSPAEV